jgi:hypothetical protein
MDDREDSTNRFQEGVKKEINAGYSFEGDC